MHKKLGISAMATAMVFSVAACGGDTGGGAGGEAQGVTDDTIKIGLFGPMSGAAAVYGKGIHTLEAMYKELNEAGGINGRKVEIVVEDTKCDPATARLAVTKLIQQEQVFMLHGGMCSAAVHAALPLIKDSGIPYLIAGAADHGLVEPPTVNVFHGWADNTGGTNADAGFVTSFAEENGGSARIAIATQADEWGRGWTKSFKSALESAEGADGIEVVAEMDISPDTTDATAQIQRLRNADVDLAVVYAYPDPMSVLLRNRHQQGLDIPIVTGQGTFPEDQLDRLGNPEPVEDFFSAYCMADTLGSEALSPYREAVEKHYPKDEFDLSSMLGVSGYDLNEHILTEMGDEVTWDNWISTAESVEGFESGAAPEPITFAPFDEGDASTRLGVNSCNLAHVNQDQGASDPIVVLPPDWTEWQEMAG